MKYTDLRYLNNKPKTIWWTVVAPKGTKLTVLQDHDLVFDDYDLQKRGINERFVDF
jgi:hypothetical protein